MEKINFLDLKKQYAHIKTELLHKFGEVLDRGVFSSGEYTTIFEEKFAQYCNTKYAIALNNGTSALHLAMLALGIGKDDEVIVPTNTFIATAWGVTYCGAKPIFVDCDELTWQIDAETIESKITNKTKAIIGVHLYGQPFDVDKLKIITKKHNLFLIEDASQAQGATYKKQKTGSFGEMACFSFYPTKNLGACGEAGGITTSNEKYYQHLQSLRNNGSIEKYYHNEIGFNMRMGSLEAVSLTIKLQYLDTWNQRRKIIAQRYYQCIQNEKITFQKQLDNTDSVYYLFVITTKERDNLLSYLAKNNIIAGLHYPVPCHLQKAYQHLSYQKGDFPHAEFLANHCLSLPIYPELTDFEVEKIIDVLNRY